MSGHRRDENYFIVGRGWVSGSLEEDGALFDSGLETTESEVSRSLSRPYRFGVMFDDLPEFRPDRAALVELGRAMERNDDLGENRKLPAGYTYLGQFITHDITFDETKDLPDGILTAAQIRQGRSPSLDLDSLYGVGPFTAGG